MRCLQELERIIDFLSRKGTINSGVLRRDSCEKPLLPPYATKVRIYQFFRRLISICTFMHFGSFCLSRAITLERFPNSAPLVEVWEEV